MTMHTYTRYNHEHDECLEKSFVETIYDNPVEMSEWWKCFEHDTMFMMVSVDICECGYGTDHNNKEEK